MQQILIAWEFITCPKILGLQLLKLQLISVEITELISEDYYFERGKYHN